MRGFKIGSRKQLLIVCGIAAFTCALLFLGDISKARSGFILPIYGTSAISTVRPTNKPSLNQPYTSASSSHRIVLLTYMRSGSSLTGDILQQMGQTFYNYEPLRMVFRSMQANRPLEFLNDTKRYPPFDFEYESLGVLRNWFTCNLRSLYKTSVMDSFLRKGIKTQSFPNCYQETIQKTGNKTYALDSCLEMLKQKCIDSPVKVVKTIRMSLKLVSQLFNEFQDLKVVHLVRDPRATLFSQARFGMCSKKHGGQTGCANAFCTRLENDVLEQELLSNKYPTRIKTVFYEDIAKTPLKTSKEIYNFVGTSFSKYVEEYVYNITMAGNPNNCVICTTRTNSSQHISAWKKKMSRKFIDVIQERCNYILKRYNYELV